MSLDKNKYIIEILYALFIWLWDMCISFRWDLIEIVSLSFRTHFEGENWNVVSSIKRYSNHLEKCIDCIKGNILRQTNLREMNSIWSKFWTIYYIGPIIFEQICVKRSSRALQSYTYVLVRSMLSYSNLPVELLKQPNLLYEELFCKSKQKNSKF